jgi:RecA/RadA recombinase
MTLHALKLKSRRIAAFIDVEHAFDRNYAEN